MTSPNAIPQPALARNPSAGRAPAGIGPSVAEIASWLRLAPSYLPGVFRAAATSLEAAKAATPPHRPAPPTPSAVLLKIAARNAREAMADGSIPHLRGEQDLAEVEVARVAEREWSDTKEFAKAVEDAMGARMHQILRDHRSEIVAGLRKAFDEHAKRMCTLAKTLPANVNDAVALNAGGDVREQWLESRDLADTLNTLQRAIFDAGGATLRALDVPLIARYITDRKLIDKWSGPGGRIDPALGEVGSPTFWLNVARETTPYAPTSDDLRDMGSIGVTVQMHPSEATGAR